MEQYYCDSGNWLRSQFPYKVQKISANAGFTCPNRDDRIGRGDCFYCSNQTFNPACCNNGKSITQQLEDDRRFFSSKYPEVKYLACFQTYTSAHNTGGYVKKLYEEILTVEDMIGLAIGTHPSYINDDLLDYFEELNHRTFLIVEYGVETYNDGTLRLINREHGFTCARKAIEETTRHGIRVGTHIILGLSGEGTKESLRQAPIISSLPLTTLKIHQLQIVRGTRLTKIYAEKPFHLYAIEECIKLIVNYVSLLRPGPVLERFVSQSPPDFLTAPKQGLKNYEFTHRLHNYMKEKLNNKAQSDK